MNLQGLTSEFSLPELFKFLQESQQTGRLSLKPVKDSNLEGKSYYFWFEKGKLLAASNRLDGLGLLNILQARSLIQSATLPRILRQCPPKVTLGQFLKDRAALTSKQLTSLFASQVLRHTCALLTATDVRFAFRASYPLPYLEMTGVSIPPTDVTLPSLRVLKDWRTLTDKLPSPSSGLKLVGDSFSYRLQTQEKNVLRLAQDGLSLSEISKALKLPIQDIQKTGFRLIFVGLVKEVPLAQFAQPTYLPKRRITKISEAFLGRLSGYLQKVPTKTQSAQAVASQAVASPASINGFPTIDVNNYRLTANLKKNARNSAVKRITSVITTDRAERLSEIAPSCLLAEYPSCSLAKKVVQV